MSWGTWKSSFSPESRGTVVGYCRKYTVGHGDWRGGHPGYHPWSRGDRASVLPAPAGGVVVAVGCTVLQMWRDGILWALQVRVLPASAVAGHMAVPGPLVGTQTCILGGPGDTWRFRTPRGRRWDRGHTCDEIESGQPEWAE